MANINLSSLAHTNRLVVWLLNKTGKWMCVTLNCFCLISRSSKQPWGNVKRNTSNIERYQNVLDILRLLL